MILPTLPDVPPSVAAHLAAAVACSGARPQVLLVADLLEPAGRRRLTVIDLRGAVPHVLLRATVAQGSGGWSNRAGSDASSAGLYSVGPAYVGDHGLAWRLDGYTAGWNDNALARAVVLHRAAYVRAHHAGRSWGCPAVSPQTLAALRADHALPPQAVTWLWIEGPGVGLAPALDCPSARLASPLQTTWRTP